MGSDNTTSATSKSRPSWRDRHLKQLSDEQLNEVEQHRGGESVAEMAGIEANPSTASNRAAAGYALDDNFRAPEPRYDRTGSKSPRSQAGPVHQRNRTQTDAARMREDRGQRQHDVAVGRQSRDAVNPGLGHDREFSGNVANDREWRDAAGHQRRSEEFREPLGGQRRRVTHDRYADRRDPDEQARYEQAVANTAESKLQPEEKKGFVARVLDFKLSAPLKYGLMALAIAVMVAVSFLKPIDSSSQSQLDSAFTRAMIGFGLARALNGVISVAQGTEFAVQPAGVGVNFSPGEILDPVNDLVERFSWVMLLATSSIGIQQILLEVSSWAGISVLLAGAGLFFLLTRLRNSSIARMADIAGKLLLAMLLVRFLIPVGALANDWVYKQFLQPQYEEASAELTVASERIKEISTRQTDEPENDGSITDRAKQLYSSMTSKFDFDGMLDDYKQSAETVSENAVNLIVVFVLQTIIFPLLFMYLIYRLFRSVVLPSRYPR